MRAVFLDYRTVSTGDLDTTSLTDAMPGLEFHARTDAVQIAARIAEADIVLLNKCGYWRELLADDSMNLAPGLSCR